MKSTPILYSTPMVQACLARRKWQTRRTKGLEEINKRPEDYALVKQDGESFTLQHKLFKGDSKVVKCPFGKPGDELWVRETFCPTASTEYIHKDTGKPYFYLADVKEEDKLMVKNQMQDNGWKWKPNIFMPKEACRFVLMIQDVSLERLHWATHKDMIDEGIECVGTDVKYGEHVLKGTFYKDYQGSISLLTAPASFKSLWESINGEGSWEKNPWVWVIKYSYLDAPSRWVPC